MPAAQACFAPALLHCAQCKPPKSSELETEGEPYYIAPSASQQKCRYGNQRGDAHLKSRKASTTFWGTGLAGRRCPAGRYTCWAGPRAARDEWRAAPCRAGTCACCVLRAAPPAACCVLCTCAPGQAGQADSSPQCSAFSRQVHRSSSGLAADWQPHLVSIQALGFVDGQRGADLRAAAQRHTARQSKHLHCLAACTPLSLAKHTLACACICAKALPCHDNHPVTAALASSSRGGGVGPACASLRTAQGSTSSSSKSVCGAAWVSAPAGGMAGVGRRPMKVRQPAGTGKAAN